MGFVHVRLLDLYQWHSLWSIYKLTNALSWQQNELEFFQENLLDFFPQHTQGIFSSCLSMHWYGVELNLHYFMDFCLLGSWSYNKILFHDWQDSPHLLLNVGWCSWIHQLEQEFFGPNQIFLADRSYWHKSSCWLFGVCFPIGRFEFRKNLLWIRVEIRILKYQKHRKIPKFNTIEYRKCSIPKFQYYWILKMFNTEISILLNIENKEIPSEEGLGIAKSPEGPKCDPHF